MSEICFAQGRPFRDFALDAEVSVEEFPRIVTRALEVIRNRDEREPRLESTNLTTVQNAVWNVVLLPASLLPATLLSASTLTSSGRPTLASASNILMPGFSADEHRDSYETVISAAIETLTQAQAIEWPQDIPHLPPISTALGPPRNFDYGGAIKRTQIGVMIETSTVPLYLYAMYSIKPGGDASGLRAQALLRGVIHQEMLHLALSGNLLSSLGGRVDLYDARIVPMFPANILCTKTKMRLERLSTESLKRFMEIEASIHQASPLPLPLPDGHHNPGDRTVLGSQYDSIGELYEDLLRIVRGLEDQRFTKNPDNQFVGQDFFWDQLYAINDQPSALRALKTVIEQGEGNLSVDDSHYDVFRSLRDENIDWSKITYPVPTDPTTQRYHTDLFAYQLSLAFDAAYCYLLQTIECVWKTSDIASRLVLFRNMHGIMSNVLTPLAGLLVNRKLRGNEQQHAAPCFNYYPMFRREPLPPLPPIKLYRALIDEVLRAAGHAPSNSIHQDLQNLRDYIERNLYPPV